MIAHDDAPDLQQEVQRLLGRCLLRLQQYETQMKYLVANHRLSGPPSALQTIYARRVREYAAKPLGHQINLLLSSFLTVEGAPAATNAGANLSSESHMFGFQSTLSMSAEDYARTKAELMAVVNARNDIVHHFAGRFDLTTRAGCCAACDYLEGCWARIDAQYGRLCTWAEGVDMARAAIAAAFMQAPGGIDLLGGDAEPGRAAQRERAGIVRALREAATELSAGESDSEWTRLDHAVALILEKHPAQTPCKYGCKSWKQVLSESRVFDLQYRMDACGERVAWFKARGAANYLARSER